MAGLYPPLKSDSSTRLFVLFPGVGSDPLRGSVDEVDLAGDHTSYEAISYTWGTAGNEKPLYIDGRLTVIWGNLSSCLYHLRDALISKKLWVDAICIAQHDLIEKAQQVEMMGQVFGHAEQVLAWLGDHDSDSEMIFSSSLSSPWRFYRPEEGPDDPFKKGRYYGQGEDQDSADFRRAWASLFRRPYWTRRWVIQELVTARQVTVHCGHSRADWSEFMAVAEESWDLEDDRPTSQLGFSIRKAIATLMGTNLTRATTATSRWPELLQTFVYTQCSDLRDRAYALLSLADQDGLDGSKLRPDYNIDLPELATRLLARSFVRPGSRDLWQRLGTAMLDVDHREAIVTIGKIVYGLDLDDIGLLKVRELLSTKSERPCVNNTAADWPNVQSDTGETPGDFWRCLAELFDRANLDPDEWLEPRTSKPG